MSSQFLQENAVGNMRHHKEHIFYISYHHLGASICHHPHQRCDSARQISQRPVAVFSAMCNQEGSSPSNPQSLTYHAGLLACPSESVKKPRTARGLFWEQLLGCIPDTSFGRGTQSSGPVLRSPFGDGGAGREASSDTVVHMACSSCSHRHATVEATGLSQGIGHGFGDSGGDGAQVKNREVEEEEVHGGLEAVVAGYSSDDEAIAQEGSQVDAQEEPESQELQLLPCVHERQEEELGDGAAVGHLLTLCKGPGQGGKSSDK
ncbi:hypothetical protein QYF61_016441 [Mycteria americana]|uniref:Uncharacterized protein n=1 Tax=Mycteria americana TaxID=33587 RepID=A0AAN7RPS9_MYCAM|nr:hypothetical protein QYF61_016441 [Mycteria americana]